MQQLKKVSDLLASYKLSCALFLLLLLLTYLGTMYQVEHGLYQSQQKYFESLFVIHWAYGVLPIPLPGGYLVLIVTFINMLWGVCKRFRLKWSKIGIFVAHTGMLILLAGTYVSYVYSLHGRLMLYEGESAAEFENSYNWEIGIHESAVQGAVTEYIIHQEDFENLAGTRSRTFRFPQLPIEIEMRGYVPNAVVSSRGPGENNFLLAKPLEKEYQRNLPGAGLTLIDKTNGTRQEAHLWAGSRTPLVLEAAGTRWNFSLRNQRIQLPFSISLDRFTRDLHPGTSMASAFTSEITKTEEGISQQFIVTMNEPFRHLGYTFYQSSWGPQDAQPGTRLYSVFSVVNNPADQVPLYACLITTLGLIFHYVQKLRAYMKREKARMT